MMPEAILVRRKVALSRPNLPGDDIEFKTTTRFVWMT